MQEPSVAGMEAETEAPCACFYARLSGGREVLLILVLLCALAKSNEALADSQCCDEFGPAPAPGSHRLSLEAPKFESLQTREFSATEFRARQRLDMQPSQHLDERPSLKTTTVWQRLSEYRAARDRIRIVTLWDGPGSSLSIQAGKRGEPSLQWTSHAGGRATRGLLDHVIAASLGSLVRSRGGPSGPAKGLIQAPAAAPP